MNAIFYDIPCVRRPPPSPAHQLNAVNTFDLRLLFCVTAPTTPPAIPIPPNQSICCN